MKIPDNVSRVIVYGGTILATGLALVYAHCDGWLAGHKSRESYDKACAMTVLADDGNELTERSRNLLEQVLED